MLVRPSPCQGMLVRLPQGLPLPQAVEERRRTCAAAGLCVACQSIPRLRWSLAVDRKRAPAAHIGRSRMAVLQADVSALQQG